MAGEAIIMVILWKKAFNNDFDCFPKIWNINNVLHALSKTIFTFFKFNIILCVKYHYNKMLLLVVMLLGAHPKSR